MDWMEGWEWWQKWGAGIGVPTSALGLWHARKRVRVWAMNAARYLSYFFRGPIILQELTRDRAENIKSVQVFGLRVAKSALDGFDYHCNPCFQRAGLYFAMKPHKMSSEDAYLFRCPSCNSKLRLTSSEMMTITVGGQVKEALGIKDEG